MNSHSKVKGFAMGRSVKSLPGNSKISAPLKAFRCFEDEPVSSLSSSVTSECKPNNSINDSISFKNLHFSEGRACSEKSFSPKSYNKINKLNQEVALLSQQLRISNEEITYLTASIQQLKIEHTSQLQSMQEKHELKLNKNKKDIDFLLNDLNSKSTAILAQQFLQKHSEEVETLHCYYQRMIEELKYKQDCQLTSQAIEKNRAFLSIKLKAERFLQSNKRRSNEIPGISIIGEIINEIKDFESGNKENESGEEMSTLESENDKKSLRILNLLRHSNLS